MSLICVGYSSNAVVDTTFVCPVGSSENNHAAGIVNENELEKF